MLVSLLIILIYRWVFVFVFRGSLRGGNVLQFASQFNTFRPTSLHVDEHHDWEREADKNGQEPERLGHDQYSRGIGSGQP